MKKILIFIMVMFVGVVQADVDPRAEDRAELRGILADMVKALNSHDFEQASKHLHKQGIVTYYNAEVSVGHEQGRAYFNRMLKESEAVVKEYRLKGDVSVPATFYGDTAVAYGVTEEYFKLAEGLEFTLHGKWSSTMQKTDGKWEIINLHFSANLFDNPLLNSAEQLQKLVGGIAFLAGLILMFLLMRFTRKNK